MKRWFTCPVCGNHRSIIYDIYCPEHKGEPMIPYIDEYTEKPVTKDDVDFWLPDIIAEVERLALPPSATL